jgi:hypothetical protein
MTLSQLREDGAAAVAVFTAPRRALDLVVARRRSLVAILIATAASLLFAAAAVPRLDFEKAATRKLEMAPAADAAEMTPFQREEAIEQARKVGSIGVYAGSAFAPAFSVLAAAFFLWLAFKVAGTAPPFKGTMAVTAHGLLPLMLSPLLELPAIFQKAPVDPVALSRLLPSNLAFYLPAGATSVLVAAASSVDLFSFWSLALLALGMARLSGASPRRAAIVVGLLWLAQVGLLRIAPTALAAASGMARGA